jgi:hypothetical protein
MANTIGSLVIDLVANTATFSTTLSKAYSDVEAGVARIKTAFGGLAEVFSIGGIADLTNNVLAFGDELQKSAAKTGLGAQAISELTFAAKQANIDLPELTSTFTKMEKSISDATTGTGTSKMAFDALGISLTQLQALSPDQQFEEIANQISKLADPTDKARAALEIFGRSGADLLPLFEQGAQGIEEARQKAVDFGASLNADQLKRIADASAAVRDLRDSFDEMALSIVGKAAPGLTKFFNSITNAFTGNLEVKHITDQIANMQTLFDAIPSEDPQNTMTGHYLQGQILQAEQQLAGLQLAKQIKDSLAAGSAMTDNAPPGFQPVIQPIDITAQKTQTYAVKAFYDSLVESTKTGAERLAESIMQTDTTLELLYDAGVISAGDFARRQSALADTTSLSQLVATNQVEITQSVKQSTDALKQSFTDASDASKIAAENMKADFDKTKNNAMQAAQSIEDSFATFLVDPFSGGLKKMLTAWIQTIDQMVAKAAAQSIFKSLFPDTGGLGAFLQSLISGGGTPFTGGGSDVDVDGFATGGAFTVGGSGSTDSQLVRFKATPGERVTVTTPSQQAQMGGVTLNQTVNIDARTDAAQIRQLVGQSTAYAIQQSQAQMVNMVKRGAFTKN